MTCTLPPKILDIIERYKLCMTLPPFHSGCRHGLGNNMREAGASYAGGGLYRQVYRYSPSCVVKIAEDEDSVGSNYEEATSWEELPRRAKKFFVPVHQIDRDGWWLVAPKVETNGEELSAEVDGMLKHHGISCEDLHGHNVGYYKGRPVVLDYGSGVSCKVKGYGIMSTQELKLNRGNR